MFFSAKRCSKNKKAFSLIELSITIVIIGVLIVGVIGSKHLVKKARINAAQAITRSSPISSIPNNKLWLESALDEVSLGLGLSTGDTLASWIDNSVNKSSIVVTAKGTGPTYSNSINYVQAVKFDANSNTNYLEIENAAFLNGTDYTIFITEKRLAVNSGTKNYLLGESGSFAVGYESDTSIIQTHAESASADNQLDVESITSYSNNPRVLTFTHSSADGNKIYVNATLANEDTTSYAKAHLSGLTTLAIGKGYNGEIGEIVIFDRDIKNSERKEIEDYLSEKWNASNNRVSTPDCTAGTILSTGCDASCTINVTGTATTTIAAGSSKQLQCNEDGYIGTTTETYVCNAGILSPSTPSTTQCTDDNASTNDGCDTGYILSGGACIIPVACTTDLPIEGSTISSVDHGSTAGISCNATGYTGESTGSTCDNDTFTPGTDCVCESGRDIATSCVDCLSGYTEVDGVCELDCTIPDDTTGFNNATKVVKGTVSIDCNKTGYEGSQTYTCETGGVYTAGTNSCILPPASCSGGSTSTTAVPGYKLHVFTADSTLTCTTAGNIEVLVVAGGGGGGGYHGGGGGAGGLLYSEVYPAAVTTYTIKVGAGGIGGEYGGDYAKIETNGKVGSDSVFDFYGLTSTITAVGGGGGSHYSGTVAVVDGGSGGGGLKSNPAGSAETGQGNDGGSSTTPWSGGGGGGAGSSGSDASYSYGGSGGTGLDYSDKFSTNYGDSGWFSSGGGGGTGKVAGGSASSGGGGIGGSPSIAPGAGDPNTGGGGGAKSGWGSPGSAGGAGGSGIVIVRYTYP